MSVPTLLPAPELLMLKGVLAIEDPIVVLVVSIRPEVGCPRCGHVSARIHSRYVRTLTDLPWGGRAVRLRLKCRRFFCDQEDCSCSIFTERLPGLAQCAARRTDRLAAVFHQLGGALGGEAGVRLANVFGLSVSADTLLRLLRSRLPSETPTPRVLGVDDWAFRRGRRYGTILVDLEERRPIDLLADRQAKTLADWLQAHPGVEVISRDRNGTYADGARAGAPTAIQVADRWHLLHNLLDALADLLTRHQPALCQAARQTAARQSAASEAGTPAPAQQAQDAGGAAAARGRAPVPGPTLGSLPPALDGTQPSVPLSQRVRRHCRPAPVEPWRTYLEGRWRQGVHNGMQLWRELVAQGFCGAHDAVARFIAPWRTQAPTRRPPTRAAQSPAESPAGKRMPRPRAVAWWLLKDGEELSDYQRDFRACLLTDCPLLSKAQALGKEFFRLVRQREASALEPWREQVAESGLGELQGFSLGLRRDWAAVVAGLTLPWNNGPVEGHINRLKLIKRQGYGRAAFDLLRARVLTSRSPTEPLTAIPRGPPSDHQECGRT